MSKNFSVSTIAGSTAPGVAGTSFTVPTGHGARFTAGAPAVVYPAGTLPSPTSAEVVTVSAIVGDVLTVVRGAESSTPRTVVLGDQLVQGITAAAWDGLVAALAGKADASALSAYLTTAAATGTYGRLAADRPGGRFVFAGDSTVAAAATMVPLAFGDSWPVYASVLSDQKVHMVADSGVFGQTSADLLANFATQVTAWAPTSVAVCIGTNDTGNSVPLATYQTNLRAIVAAIRGIGAVPVLCTILPTSSTTPTNRSQLVQQYNDWIRRYAQQQGIALLDLFAQVVDPATGGYLSTYNADNVHPNAAGYQVLGQYVATTLGALVPSGGPVVTQSNVDENNLLYNGLFLGGATATIPNGWTDLTGGVTGCTLSFTTGAGVPGNLTQFACTASSGSKIIQYAMNLATGTVSSSAVAGATTLVTSVNPFKFGTLFLRWGTATQEIVKVTNVSGSGPFTCTLARGLAYAATASDAVIANGRAGDTFAMSGRVVLDGNQAVSVQVQTVPAGTVKALSSLSKAVSLGTYYAEFVAPAGTTELDLQYVVAAGTGTQKFGQPTVKNLTLLGA